LAVAVEIRQRIVHHLASVEAEEHVRVLFAVESGSRAWGFPSADSDYDIRLIYVRPEPWYLSIDLEARRDVIERPCVDLIDLSGWDIRKALGLFARSNPPLLEWLDSPIVYADRLGFASRLRGMLPDYFSPVGALHHYLQMARGNFRSYLQGERVRPKKYFYVLRPLLAARWIEQGRGPVPMLFSALLDTVSGQAALGEAIAELLGRKLSGAELDEGPRVPALQEFIVAELGRLESVAGTQPKVRGESEPLNQLFREYLRRAWGEAPDAEQLYGLSALSKNDDSSHSV
jgi:predicted nucleotidyltransferase